MKLPRRRNDIKVNISGAFWSGCCELRSKEIGEWLREEKHAPWPNGKPPRFEVQNLGGCRFAAKKSKVS
jgi:hypothetical protein